MRLRLVTAREAALNILATRFENAPLNSRLPLAGFQREGAQRARQILERRGLVLLADTVGLGKTFTALAVMESAAARELRIALVTPAALRRTWRRALRQLLLAPGTVTMVSHTMLGLGRAPPGHFGLVVVDEAHAFRNPRTRRYVALRQLCRQAPTLLITATPINNSLSDLYFQIRLGCGDGALRDLGISSLREALLTAEPRAADLATIRSALIVRRHRADLPALTDPAMRFPARLHMAVAGYALPMSAADIGARLHALTFIGYTLCTAACTPDLLRFALLKRMESSNHAIVLTLTRAIRFYEALRDAIGRGRTLSPREFRALYARTDDATQLILEDVALEKHRFDSADIPARVDAELQRLRAWLAEVACADDAKLAVLRDLLRTRPPRAKTLIFTEYRDTAQYLWRALRRSTATGLIVGEGAWLGETRAPRSAVIERFAPVANGARVHPREAIDVLIATDVLAEGMNLQDADAVISYDLPWNPVKLIQRAGRVDRIGSPHDVVFVHNFIPDREFDAFLGVARRIRTKLATVRGVIGLERPVLEPDEDLEHLFRGLATGDAGVLRMTDRSGAGASVGGRYEVPRVRAGIPCGRLAVSGAARVLVGLERRGESVLLQVDCASGAVSRPEDGEDVLARALESAALIPVDEPLVKTALARCLLFVDSTPALLGLQRRSAAARLAERIRAGLAELPFGETAAVYAEAELVLQQLGNPVSSAAEARLEQLCRKPYTSLGALLRACRTACEVSTAPISPGKWQVSGVLLLD